MEQARRARERAKRLRALTRGINDGETVERLETLAREIEDTADQLEMSASHLDRNASHAAEITGDVKAAMATTQDLLRRLKKLAGEGI